jgi:hypothetical protein
MPKASALAVRKSIKVDAPPDVAFEVFTAGMTTWWPLKTHSVSESRTVRVTMEPRLGGRCTRPTTRAPNTIGVS